MQEKLSYFQINNKIYLSMSYFFCIFAPDFEDESHYGRTNTQI